MKKTITFVCVLFAAAAMHAQMVYDSVYLGAGYANQVWYSLQNDEEATAPKNNWDLAFEINGFTTAILLNTANGDEVWTYPNGDTASWATLDTTGIAGWSKVYNSDTTWAVGAFNANYDPANDFDLGWGMYNLSNHNVVGDSLYVVKLADGSYKKLWLQRLASGIYSFKYANLNGTGETAKTIAKANYPNKNFAYFSLASNTALDREPESANWDLLFTNYTTFIPTPYTVTGIVQNTGVEVAKAYPVNDVATYDDYSSLTFATAINTIGYNWKKYDFSTSSYKVEDSTVFFVKAKNDAVWKIVLTGFAMADGKFVFGKENLTPSTTGIHAVNNTTLFAAVYPNPASAGNVSLTLDADKATTAQVNVIDMSGRIVACQTFDATNGLATYTLGLHHLAHGVYMVNVTVGAQTATQKLVIN